MEKTRIELFKVLAGSRGYGLNRPDSDYDWRHVYTLSKEELMNPFDTEKQQQVHSEDEDIEKHELRNFLRLASDCNPNIIEFLFFPTVEYIHPLFQKYFVDNRHLFLAQTAKTKFVGYMKSQLHRVENHRAWFKNPPQHEPQREDYHVPVFLTNEALASIVNFSSEVVDEKYRPFIPQWRLFLIEKKKWQNYQSWIKTRNPERAELEKKFGYDTKHASHLLRLGFEAEDILTEKTIHIPSKHVQEILDVRNGKWTIEQVTNFADKMEEKLSRLSETSDLPEKTDKKLIAELYCKFINELEKKEG